MADEVGLLGERNGVVGAGQGDAAAAGRQQPGEDAQQARLAGSVAAAEDEAGARPPGQRTDPGNRITSPRRQAEAIGDEAHGKHAAQARWLGRATRKSPSSGSRSCSGAHEIYL